MPLGIGFEVLQTGSNSCFLFLLPVCGSINVISQLPAPASPSLSWWMLSLKNYKLK